MFGSKNDELEARVARLERLLERVLVLIRELQAEGKVEGRSPGGTTTAGMEAAGAAVEPGAPTAAGPASATGPGSAAGPGRATGPGTETGPTAAPGRVSQPSARIEASTGESVKARAARLDEMVSRAILVPRGTLLGRLGIVLLLLSVAYFFKYSIDQGWLTEWVRLAIGVGVGVTLSGLGFKGAGKGEPLGTVLAGGGIATFFITGFVGHQWFELVSYPVAFGFLVAASGFGIFLSLRSGIQVLGIVGLIGALATPLILTSPDPKVVGLALYVSIIVAAVATIYMARGWRALLLLAVVTACLVLSPAVSLTAGEVGAEAWVIQGAIAFYVLAFWTLPLGRTILWAADPARWVRPNRTGTPWNTHLDALSLLMPLVGILMSGWLWELPRFPLGLVFLGTALLALAVGYGLSQSQDPEDSASTQQFVAIVLCTVGLGLVLEGDILYLAFVAEAVALMVVGSRRESRVLMGLGGVVEAIVLGIFLFRLGPGETFLEGDLSPVFDLAAIGGAVVIGTQLKLLRGRQGFLAGAYLAFLALLVTQLSELESILYLALILLALVTHGLAASRKSPFFSTLGHLPVLLFLTIFLDRLGSDHTLWANDLTSFLDLLALGAAAYVGTLLDGRQGRQAYLFGGYAGLLAWTARELYPFEQGQAFMSLAFGVEGTVLLVAGLMADRSALQQIGMATLLLVVVKVLLVDLAAVEPIWRVLLLLAFALLFLVLSKFVQGRRRDRP